MLVMRANNQTQPISLPLDVVDLHSCRDMQCINLYGHSAVLAFMSSIPNDDGEGVATACDASSNLNRQHKAHRLYRQLDNGSSEQSWPTLLRR